MYEGQYVKDKKEGFGIFKWASGNTYIGQYKADEREGIGKMCWIDTSMYIGQWKHGIQNGYGIMLFPDESIKQGLFENNIYKGPANPVQPLNDPSFDIMKLAPPGIRFSDEILNLRTIIRPNRAQYDIECLPSVNRSKSERRNTKPPLKPSIQKGSERSQNKKRINNVTRLITIHSKADTNSYRYIDKGESIEGLRKVKVLRLYNASSNNSSLTQLRTRKVTKRKICKPSGPAQYNNTMNFAKKYYL